jgi:hypothetical protein
MSLQQKNCPELPLVGGRHWYPDGQLSLVLQGAFAPGGLAPPEKQLAKVTMEMQQRMFDTVME